MRHIFLLAQSLGLRYKYAKLRETLRVVVGDNNLPDASGKVSVWRDHKAVKASKSTQQS